VAKEMSELTCTEYWTAFVLELVDGFHCSWIAQDPEQMASGSVISTGLVGGAVGDKVKESDVAQAETVVVLRESRA